MCLVKTCPSCSLLSPSLATCVLLLGWADRSHVARLSGRAARRRRRRGAQGEIHEEERDGVRDRSEGREGAFPCFSTVNNWEAGGWKMQRPSEKAVWLRPARPDPSYGLTTHTHTHNTHTCSYTACWAAKSQVIIGCFCSASLFPAAVYHPECNHLSALLTLHFINQPQCQYSQLDLEDVLFQRVAVVELGRRVRI